MHVEGKVIYTASEFHNMYTLWTNCQTPYAENSAPWEHNGLCSRWNQLKTELYNKTCWFLDGYDVFKRHSPDNDILPPWV